MKLKPVSLTVLSSLFILLTFSNSIFSSIDPAAQQMVNLNIQIKGKKKPVRTDIAMPFYQTAELEKRVDNKDYLFEVNPKKGKNSSEIELEVRLFNKKGSKIIAKKEIIAKINEVATISMKGVTFKVTPQI